MGNLAQNHGAEDPIVITLNKKNQISERNMPPFRGKLLCNLDVPDIIREPDHKKLALSFTQVPKTRLTS
jgi:hypothetical protein